jgi:plasmid stability protein
MQVSHEGEERNIFTQTIKNHRRIVMTMTVNKGSLREETLELQRTTVCSDVKSPDVHVLSGDYST